MGVCTNNYQNYTDVVTSSEFRKRVIKGTLSYPTLRSEGSKSKLNPRIKSP